MEKILFVFVVHLLRFLSPPSPPSQVSSAVDHIQSGTTALHKAKKLQKNSRKCMCIAIIILLLIVVIIVVAVLKPWSKSG